MEIVIPGAGVPSVQEPAGVVAALEEPTRTGYTLAQLIAAWIGELCRSPASEDAYRRGARHYIQWCADHDLDVLGVRPPEASMYAHHLRTAIVPRTGRPYSPKSQDRDLAIVSSLYRYLTRERVIDGNPFSEVRRPNAGTPERHTPSLSPADAAAAMAAAGRMTHRTLGPVLPELVLRLMFMLGIRVSEVCGLDHESVGRSGGVRTLTVHAKGEKSLLRPMPVELAALLDAYRVQRPVPAEGDADARRALLLDAGGRRIRRGQVRKLLVRVAREAGVPVISPHGSRHTFNMWAKSLGADLESRRMALGHAKSSTTEQYDLAVHRLENDPAHLLAQAMFPGGGQKGVSGEVG